MIAISVEGRTVIDPANPMWCTAMPTPIVGPTIAPAGLADPLLGNDLSANRIRPDQAIRTMLLGGPDRQDNDLGSAKVGLDFLPSLMLQKHAVSS